MATIIDDSRDTIVFRFNESIVQLVVEIGDDEFIVTLETVDELEFFVRLAESIKLVLRARSDTSTAKASLEGGVGNDQSEDDDLSG